jgi:murein DD-endopeptidase MepM/ murein hydrolase activator NlpD
LRGRSGAAAAALALLLFAGACASRAPVVAHVVKPGENLYRISAYYRVSVSRIMDANGLTDPTALEPGDELVIPGARRPAASETLLPPPGGSSEGSPLVRPSSKFTGLGDLQPNALSRYAAVREARKAGLRFAWPLDGAITSGFGRRGLRRHQGIDVRGAPGLPIVAAEAGRVLHAGWLGDYGNAVVIAHAGGFATIYAHAVVLGVAKNEAVAKGQVIALVGSTGNATGPHLHFEIRRRDKARNPLLYLPAEP